MRPHLLTFAALGLLAACHGSTDVDSAACGGRCGALSDPIVATVARLWVEKSTSTDRDFAQDSLMIEPVAADGVAPQVLAVSVYTADQDVLGGVADLTRGAQAIAVLRDGRYPARAEVDLFMRHDDHTLIGYDGASHLRTSVAIAGPDALPRARAAALTLPFSLWRVRIAARVDRLIATMDGYTVPISGWTSGGSATLSVRDAAALANLRRDELTTVTLIAPASGPITAKGFFIVGSTGRAPQPMRIEGPGDYVAEADGLRRANPGELPAPETPDGGADPAVDLASAPDLATPWPATCGGDGQSACNADGFVGCAPHLVSRYTDFGDTLCHACGADGQYPCADASNNKVCDPGAVMRYTDFQDLLCHTCGADGQYPCADASGAKVCDPGTVMRYTDFQDLLCHTCGADGQYPCADAAGAKVCNAGLAVSYPKNGDTLCHPI